MNTDFDPALDALARHGADAAHLDTAAAIRGRADRRRRRRTVGGVAVAVVAGIALGPLAVNALGGDGATSIEPAPQPTFTEPAPEPSEAPPTPDETLTSESQPIVDLQTYADRWVVPDVEGGLVQITDRADAVLATGYRLVPLDGNAVQIVTVTTTDGEPHCLAASDIGVGLSRCGDFPADERFVVTELDASGVVNISSEHGLLYATPDHQLATGGNPDSPASVFYLK